VLSGGNNWLLGYWGGAKGSAYFDGDVLLYGNGDSDTAPHLYTATIGGSGQDSTFWAEGVQIASNQGGTVGPDGLFLGGGGAYSEYSDCDVSEVLVYHRVLTPLELNQVGFYLTQKYGISSAYEPTGGFGSWAAANAPGQTPQQDHDNDGVKNGIEFFMGKTGSSFTVMPGLDGTNTIIWPASAAYQGTYEVQTSTDLATWTNVSPRPTPSGGNLSYTLPTGAPSGKSFVRLLVTPTP
jgi:hypothetical protein